MIDEGRRYREAMEAAQVAQIEGEDEADQGPPDPESHEATLQAMGNDFPR
jgi:hypothetical protein